MNGFNFTDRVRAILALSREEALRLGHEYVGTEHILLGVLGEEKGVPHEIMQNLSVDADAMKARIEQVVKRGDGRGTAGTELPYTNRARKVLELGMTEAHELGHGYVGAEHLLLGLLREEQGIAAQVLVQAGLSVPLVRAEALRLLGEDRGHSAPDQPAAPRAGHAAAGSPGAPRSVVIELQHADGWHLRRELKTIRDAIDFLRSQE